MAINKVVSDGKEQRIQLELLTQQLTNRLQSFLPSNYYIDISSSSHGSHLRTLAREYAVMRTFSFDVQADSYYTEVRPEFLVRNVGYLLDFFDIRFNTSSEQYRSFLLALVVLYFGGSTPQNIKRGVEMFTEVPVNIIELFKQENIGDPSEGSGLNVKTIVLNGDGRVCYRPFILNRLYKINREFISILDTFKWAIELFVTNRPAAMEFVGNTNIVELVDIIKPDHTLFGIRNIFEEAIPGIQDLLLEMALAARLEEPIGCMCLFLLNNPGNNYIEGVIPPSLLNDSSCIEPEFCEGHTLWTPVYSLGAQLGLYTLASDGSRIVAGGETGIIVSSDDDGFMWNTETSGTTDTLRNVIYTGTQYIAVGGVPGSATSLILTSPTGDTWTPQASPHVNAYWFCVAASDSLILAVGQDQDEITPLMMSSTDGITWFSETPPSGTDIQFGIHWTGAYWITVGQNGSIYTSTDGISWVSKVSGTAEDLKYALWNGTTYLAVGSNGIALTCTNEDGTSWIVRDTGFTDPGSWEYSWIVWVESTGRWIVSGGDWSTFGVLVTTCDFDTWIITDSGTHVVGGIPYKNVTFHGVGAKAGENGGLIRSFQAEDPVFCGGKDLGLSTNYGGRKYCCLYHLRPLITDEVFISYIKSQGTPVLSDATVNFESLSPTGAAATEIIPFESLQHTVITATETIPFGTRTETPEMYNSFYCGSISGTEKTWTAMPAATTEAFGNTSTRTTVPLIYNHLDRIRITAYIKTAGFAGSTLTLQYDSTGGGTWVSLSVATVAIDTAGVFMSPFADLPMNALNRVFRLVGQGGNGVVSPKFHGLRFEAVSIPVPTINPIYVYYRANTGAGGIAWPGQPAAETEWPGHNVVTSTIGVNRKIFDLRNFTYISTSVTVSVIGAVGSSVKLQYSLNGTTWVDIVSFPIDVAGYQTVLMELPVGARTADTYIRHVGVGGNSIASPFLSFDLYPQLNPGYGVGSSTTEFAGNYTTRKSYYLLSSGNWVNQPAALSEFGNTNSPPNSWWIRTDLTNYATFRYFVTVYDIAASGATIHLQYSSNGGSSWDDISGTTIAIDSSGFKFISGITVPTAIRNDTGLLRIVGEGGNGVTDPNFGAMGLEFIKE